MRLTDKNFENFEGADAARTGVAGPVRGQRVSMGFGPGSLTVALVLGVLVLAACGPRRLNVVLTPEQMLVATGYSVDRSRSILGANNQARLYCERQKKTVVFLNEDTIYQGQYDEDLTAATRTAGRVAGALGSREAAAASRALSSPTDYKTTFEFLCQ